MHPPPHSSVVKGLNHGSPMYLARPGQSGHSGVPSHHSKSTPQDLSAHGTTGSEKAGPLELTPHSSSHHKPLPHIHTVVSPNVSGNQIGTLLPAHQTDRGSYYRMPDSVINVQGPAAVLVSSVGEAGVSSHPHVSQAALIHAHSSLPVHTTAANLTTMPPISLAATVSVPGGVNLASAAHLTHNHLMPNECLPTPHLVSGCAVSEASLRDVKKEKGDQLEGMRLPGESQQVAGPQRDLVRQALQAVVTNPQHKTGNDQEVIEYNYTAGDIAELLMMNIQVNASLQAINKGSGVPEAGTGQVVMLQPAAVDETNCLQQQPLTPKQRRRPKLSDDGHIERRVRIALRMREKRATESDDQKKVRRIREAERMRRKRATEDEDSKMARRCEAAARARNRRATMSLEERIMDRQRAADRMRLRRATESEEVKTLRRLKAAERMRKRRSVETPEQRNIRRQQIAMRMKARRKCKSEGSINGDEDAEIIPITRSITTRYGKTSSAANSVTSPESSEPVTSLDSEQSINISTPHNVTTASHVFVPSTIGVGGSIALLQVDPSSAMPIAHSSGLSTVDVSHLSQPLSLQKSASTTTQDQEMSRPLSLQKHTPVSTAAPGSAVALSTMTTMSHGSSEPLHLHKGTSYHHHHHLPHLLQYHHPLTSTQQQQANHHLSHHHHHHHHPHHHLQQRHQH
ncbi:hypothetical protein Pmani_009421 [Petrolisthes manimaculis]|uniref:Uncharacterized protein n=1 Tax=Petrolisthes manimaculis TaxID=1843537 RepID=A0AAE1Q471_9EUCA|nr:hypothetical protein Pmani_009421 [Petrolisthes manimaculis]